MDFPFSNGNGIAVFFFFLFFFTGPTQEQASRAMNCKYRIGNSWCLWKVPALCTKLLNFKHFKVEQFCLICVLPSFSPSLNVPFLRGETRCRTQIGTASWDVALCNSTTMYLTMTGRISKTYMWVFLPCFYQLTVPAIRWGSRHRDLLQVVEFILIKSKSKHIINFSIPQSMLSYQKAFLWLRTTFLA